LLDLDFETIAAGHFKSGVLRLHRIKAGRNRRKCVIARIRGNGSPNSAGSRVGKRNGGGRYGGAGGIRYVSRDFARGLGERLPCCNKEQGAYKEQEETGTNPATPKLASQDEKPPNDRRLYTWIAIVVDTAVPVRCGRNWL
jgi:hypothetical protein